MRSLSYSRTEVKRRSARWAEGNFYLLGIIWVDAKASTKEYRIHGDAAAECFGALLVGVQLETATYLLALEHI
jgi:hypothetical protein